VTGETFADMISEELGKKHDKKVIVREEFRVDGKGCCFRNNPELNSKSLSSVVFPRYIDVNRGFGSKVAQGSRFTHQRLQLCDAINVHLKDEADLREWK